MLNGYLRQATASQVRLIGPYLDDTDGKTPETALTIANTDLLISKNGAASAAKNSGGGTHIAQGMYAATFDGTDTSAVGEMSVISLVAGARLVVAKFVVLEEAIFDLLFVAGAPTARAEPAQGAPAASTDPLTKLDYLYKAWRNKKTQTATTMSLYDDAGTTVDQKATISDDGTTYTHGELGTGP